MVTNTDAIQLLISSNGKKIQSEKPRHLKYLNEFRVEQCLRFREQQCLYHRPYTCFHWHFQNQKRRTPYKKEDGTFNYNPDVYCDKYDEKVGVCIDGDDCPYAHRNAGDTERRYHPRYFKTGNCIYETAENGACVKNGLHCAFAHGPDDIRLPLYDIREVQDSSSMFKFTVNLPASLEKDRVLSEDPKWNEMFHVLSRYKTEMCKKPPRMCRQGYSCPFYHNGKDKRRAPDIWRYRSTPCPNVRPGDEWQDSSICESGDMCMCCHTRTEQQFHPEIYKSTRCNDVVNFGYCPRGPFCAFAHSDAELSIGRDFLVSLQQHQLLADGLGGITGIVSPSSSSTGGSSGRVGTQHPPIVSQQQQQPRPLRTPDMMLINATVQKLLANQPVHQQQHQLLLQQNALSSSSSTGSGTRNTNILSNSQTNGTNVPVNLLVGLQRVHQGVSLSSAAQTTSSPTAAQRNQGVVGGTVEAISRAVPSSNLIPNLMSIPCVQAVPSAVLLGGGAVGAHSGSARRGMNTVPVTNTNGSSPRNAATGISAFWKSSSLSPLGLLQQHASSSDRSFSLFSHPTAPLKQLRPFVNHHHHHQHSPVMAAATSTMTTAALGTIDHHSPLMVAPNSAFSPTVPGQQPQQSHSSLHQQHHQMSGNALQGMLWNASSSPQATIDRASSSSSSSSNAITTAHHNSSPSFHSIWPSWRRQIDSGNPSETSANELDLMVADVGSSVVSASDENAQLDMPIPLLFTAGPQDETRNHDDSGLLYNRCYVPAISHDQCYATSSSDLTTTTLSSDDGFGSVDTNASISSLAAAVGSTYCIQRTKMMQSRFQPAGMQLYSDTLITQANDVIPSDVLPFLSLYHTKDYSDDQLMTESELDTSDLRFLSSLNNIIGGTSCATEDMETRQLAVGGGVQVSSGSPVLEAVMGSSCPMTIPGRGGGGSTQVQPNTVKTYGLSPVTERSPYELAVGPQHCNPFQQHPQANTVTWAMDDINDSQHPAECITSSPVHSSRTAALQPHYFSPVVGTPLVHTTHTSNIWDNRVGQTNAESPLAQVSSSYGSCSHEPEVTTPSTDSLSSHATLRGTIKEFGIDQNFYGSVHNAAVPTSHSGSSFTDLPQSPFLLSTPFSNPCPDLERLSLKRELNEVKQRLDTKENEVERLKRQHTCVTEQLRGSLDAFYKLMNTFRLQTSMASLTATSVADATVTNDFSMPLFVDTATECITAAAGDGGSAISESRDLSTSGCDATVRRMMADPDLLSHPRDAAFSSACTSSSVSLATSMQTSQQAPFSLDDVNETFVTATDRCQSEQQEALASLFANPFVTSLLQLDDEKARMNFVHGLSRFGIAWTNQHCGTQASVIGASGNFQTNTVVSSSATQAHSPSSCFDDTCGAPFDSPRTASKISGDDDMDRNERRSHKDDTAADDDCMDDLFSASGLLPLQVSPDPGDD